MVSPRSQPVTSRFASVPASPTPTVNAVSTQGAGFTVRPGTAWPRQLAALRAAFEAALTAQDWDQLAVLDKTLQQLLPALRARMHEPATRAQLAQINALYTTMLAAGQAKKAEIQQQINQQASTREGVMAYLQHQ